MKEESNIGHMPQLSKFAMVHSAAGEFIVLKTAYIDSLAGTKWLTPQIYPDQTITIKLADAKELLAELKKSIDYIEAGIEHPSCTFHDRG
ncbi:hypothetical protein [Martelella alba]|uniref:Uncharacterized protein n=1 Tax=Martelella alba TaxID=2590451 RepID=A0ABY2SFT0_9HYPH|nr:hypothetical protein [Martelella alba]TKI03871.1 hypothetical protein FCN80_20320 [Martelella alba]